MKNGWRASARRWLEDRRVSESEIEDTPTDVHKPEAWMLVNGYAEEALEDDLRALPDERLREIALLCTAETYQPDECVPCLAHVLLSERIQARKDAQEPPEEPQVPSNAGETLNDQGKIVYATDLSPEPTNRPIEKVFAEKVNELQHIVEDLLAGPPIPPREVSYDELAALVVGAEKWVQMMDAQGMELAPKQEAIKERVVAAIKKIRRDG